MANYPNEIVDMIMILGESRNNYAAAARLHAERYPNRRHPMSQFKELEMKLANADIINVTKMICTLLSF